MSLRALPAPRRLLPVVKEASSGILALPIEFHGYFGSPEGGSLGIGRGLPTFSVPDLDALELLHVGDRPGSWTYLLFEGADGTGPQRINALAEVENVLLNPGVTRFGWEGEALGVAAGLRILAEKEPELPGNWLFGLAFERTLFTRHFLVERLRDPLRLFLPIAPCLSGFDLGRLYGQDELLAALRAER